MFYLSLEKDTYRSINITIIYDILSLKLANASQVYIETIIYIFKSHYIFIFIRGLIKFYSRYIEVYVILLVFFLKSFTFSLFILNILSVTLF